VTETYCSKYNLCKQYGTYGESCEEDPYIGIYTYFDNSEKQIIKILASIDQKLSKLLEK